MTPHDFNLRHLRALCEVARAGSVSAACDIVHLSQPAITQALARMEQQCGVALFLRRRSGMYPTEPGRLLALRAERALSFIATGAERAKRPAARRQRTGTGRFDHLVTTAQLRALVALSEIGNFSQAARNIGISQPSLHRAARDLERLAGVPMFQQTGQGIALTLAAQTLARSAGVAFAELRQGLDEIAALQGKDRGEVRIGSLPLARSRILPSAIGALTAARPEVRVSVADGQYTDMLTHLRHGHLDVIIGALRDPLPADDVKQEKLFDDALAVVGRADHPLCGAASVSLRDLVAQPWVVPSRGIPTRDHFDALFTSAALSAPSQIVESSSLILLRGLLLQSDRLTLISPQQVRHEIEQGLLGVLDVKLPAPSRPIGITTRKDWHPTGTQDQFLKLLRIAAADATGSRGP